MILTGMAANPLSVEAGTIVANHMGYLLDLSDDLKRLIVMFPPEPILAIIAHTIIDEKIEGNQLFKILQDKFQAVDIDYGKTAEIFGGMIILRAIWKSPSVSLPPESFSNYQQFLDHIKIQAPYLNGIWERSAHILEDDTERYKIQAKIDKLSAKLSNLSENDSESEEQTILNERANLMSELEQLPVNNVMSEFSGYKVHTVEEFLKMMLNLDLLSHLPQVVLEGLVNGTHTVNLDSFSENLQFGSKTFTPSKPAVADERIADPSRFILTEDLLRLCFVSQVIIKFPPGYYGLDYAIPVLLKSGTFTFIGVQIKRADANTSDDVFKMRARLHLVKCPLEICEGLNCKKCINDEALKLIYQNQISIVISLDKPENFSTFKSSTSCFEGCTKMAESYLTELFRTCDDLPKGMGPSRSRNFFKPLINMRKPLKKDILISKSLWFDKYVNLKNIQLTKTKSIRFKKDTFIQRQFCISVRGWDNYQRLFTSFNSSVNIAQRLMDAEGLLRHFPVEGRNHPDFIRKLIYDMSLTFPMYSAELRSAYGQDSWFDSLNREVARQWETEVTRSASIATGEEVENDLDSETEESASDSDSGSDTGAGIMPAKRPKLGARQYKGG